MSRADTKIGALKQLALEHGLFFISSVIVVRNKSTNQLELEKEYDTKLYLPKWYETAKASIARGSPYASCVIDIILDGSVFGDETSHASTLVLTLCPKNKIIACRHDGHGKLSRVDLNEFAETLANQLCKSIDPNLSVKFVPLTDAVPVQSSTIADCYGWSVILAIFTSLNPQYAKTPNVLYSAIKKAGVHQISILFYLYLLIYEGLKYLKVDTEMGGEFHTMGDYKHIIRKYAKANISEFGDDEERNTSADAVARLFNSKPCTHKLWSRTAAGEWKCNPKFCTQCASFFPKDMTCVPKIIMRSAPQDTFDSHYEGMKNVYACNAIVQMDLALLDICMWGKKMYPSSAILFEYAKRYVPSAKKQGLFSSEDERRIFVDPIAAEYRSKGGLECISESEEGCIDTQKRKRENNNFFDEIKRYKLRSSTAKR